jgi:flagellin-like protein
MIRFHVAKRRGVSEIFATLMLLAITTAGSLFLANLVQGSGIGSVGQNPSLVSYSSYSIKFVGYDTRDGADLSEISTLDNKFDKKLCTVSCTAFADNVPLDANGGTEFIVLQIKNASPNPVFIRNVQINGITHSWDPQTGGRDLVASTSDYTGNYPLAGKFSILSTSGLSQRSDNQLNEDEEIRLVVKLSRDISSDISLTRPLQIYIDFGGQRSAEHVVLSGETR